MHFKLFEEFNSSYDKIINHEMSYFKMYSEIFENRFEQSFIDKYCFHDDKNSLELKKILKDYLPGAIYNVEIYDQANNAIYDKFQDWDITNMTEFFKKHGTLVKIPIASLTFSQEEVNVEKSYSPGKPICVVNFKHKNVLINGYHRVVDAIVNHVKEMDCYYLRLK